MKIQKTEKIVKQNPRFCFNKNNNFQNLKLKRQKFLEVEN